MTVKALIPICIIVGLLSNSNGANLVRTGPKQKTDTLSKFDIGLSRVDVCSKPSCMNNIISQAKKLNSVLVVYKNKSQWITVDEKSKSDSVLREFPVKKISIGSGRITVNEKTIRQQNIVILE